MKKLLLTMVMSLMMCIELYAQGYEWKMPPKTTEKVVGKVSMEHSAGFLAEFDTESNRGIRREDHRRTLSDTEMYESLLRKAKNEYGKAYPRFELRSFSSSYNDRRESSTGRLVYTNRTYYSSATVVVPDAIVETNDNLPEVVDKALRNVPVGSRLAIDQIIVTINMDGEMLKDKLVDMLLDKGYRVVAKEYLEKLYKEQQDQQSGIYNERTTVSENNFSAVGYFINLKATDVSMRVQVVNVSTGEYEGNATVNF